MPRMAALTSSAMSIKERSLVYLGDRSTRTPNVPTARAVAW
jgi:hypothetical protein